MKPVLVILLGLMFSGFLTHPKEIEETSLIQIPKGFPEIEFPVGNEPTEARISLGKKLFFDPILSRDFSISCSSCHKPSLGFSDSLMLSTGVAGALGRSNAPSLTNVAYSPYLNRDGGVPTLEMQVLVPIQEHLEFDMNILTIAERLNEDSSYVEMSLKAYNRRPDSFVITRALANFERTLISGDSKYDKYAYQNKTEVFNEDEFLGMELFFSDRVQCSSCHSGFTFTNYEFENNGLYLEYADSGRIRLTGLEEDRARFKVPTLRNLEYTAPYMHDGSIDSLEDVIDHYSNGIKTHQNLSNKLEPMNFSEEEKMQLVVFLRALSDEEFVSNKKFQKK